MGGEPRLRAGRTIRRAVADLGAAPGGVSNARFVATSDWTEYIVKAPTLCAGVGPYIPANELIAAELAVLVDIPVLPWVFIELPSGDLGWGSLRIHTADFARMSPAVAAHLDDSSMFSAIAVFDLWIGNTDRHGGNLLGKRAHVGGGYSLLANDHSHALLREHRVPGDLEGYWNQCGPADFWRCPQLVENVSDCRRLRSTIDSIEAMSDAVIGTVVANVPDDWMSGSVKADLTEVLIRRALRIRSLMQAQMSWFPQTPGVVL